MRLFKSISFGFYLTMFLLAHLVFIGLNALVFGYNFAPTSTVFKAILEEIMKILLLPHTSNSDENATFYVNVFLYGLLFSFIIFSILGYLKKIPPRLLNLANNLTLCIALFLVIMLPLTPVVGSYAIAVNACVIIWYIITIVYKNVLPPKSHSLISILKAFILILVIFYVLCMLFTSANIIFYNSLEEVMAKNTNVIISIGLKLLVFILLFVGYIYSNGYYRPSFGVFWLRMFAFIVVFFKLGFVVFTLILLTNKNLLTEFMLFMSFNDNFFIYLKTFVFLGTTLCFSVALRDGVAKARFGLKRFMELSLSSSVFLIIFILFFHLMYQTDLETFKAYEVGKDNFLNVFLFCFIISILNTFLLFIYRSKTQRLYNFLQIISRYMYAVAFLCVCGFVFLDFSLLFLVLAALVLIYGFGKALRIRTKKTSKTILGVFCILVVCSIIFGFAFSKYKENKSKTTESETRTMCDKTREVLIKNGYCEDISDCKRKRLVGYNVDGDKAFIFIHVDKTDISNQIIDTFKSYKKTNKATYEIYFYKEGLEVSPYFDESIKQANFKVLI